MDKRTIAFYFLILLVIGLGVYLLFYIKTESYECMASPLLYGVSKVESSEPFTCTCTTFNSLKMLIVTKDNISLVDKYLLPSNNNFNLSIPKS